MAIDLVDTRGAAELLGVSEATMRNWRKAGTGPRYLKLGDGETSLVRYRVSDVEAWVCEQAAKVRGPLDPSPDEVF